MKSLGVVLVGAGGYGSGYVDAVLDRGPELGLELAGVVEPAPSSCARLEEVLAVTGRIYASFEEYSADRGRRKPTLVVISAPIPLHASIAIAAMDRGCDVLCEKPIAGSIQDARQVAAAAAKSGRQVVIGFQWSFSPVIERIRRDVAAGTFGAPRRLRSLVLRPRSTAYYRRSPWAGALRTDDRWVLDSPANNANAHYLHNLFDVLRDRGDRPATVTAELYRANDIDSFDTAAMRIVTDSGAELLYFTSHAVEAAVGPRLEYEFDDAKLSFTPGAGFIARFRDGRKESYGEPEGDHAEKLRRCAEMLRGDADNPCAIEDALSQLITVCAAHESTEVTSVPRELLRDSDGADPVRFVDGLAEALVHCYDTGRLPAETGKLTWAAAGRPFSLAGYRTFAGPKR